MLLHNKTRLKVVELKTRRYFANVVKLIWCCVLLIPSTLLNAAESKFIPNESEYSAFLLNGWRAQRPNLLVFKDPFCPYCIRAIPKLEQLTAYNVYLFWSPILGSSSQARVEQIFNCERIASKQVLDAVVLRQSPQCSQGFQANLKKLNDKVVNNYQINAVPSFFLQGKNVSLASLIKAQNTRPPINGVRINWQKFALMKYSDFYQAKNLVMYVPNAQKHNIAELLKTYQPEYVFLEDANSEQYNHLLGCNQNPESCQISRQQEYQHKTQEFKLLMGSSLSDHDILIFDETGQPSQLKI